MPRESCPTPGRGECLEWCGTHCGPGCCDSHAWLQSQAQKSHAVHAAVSPTPVKPNRSRRIMLWQGEKNHVGRLAYMYWPVMGTLLEGLRHAGEAEVLLGVGFSLAYHAALARLHSGDVLIWVGTNGKLSQPWRKLRQRGVRTVYYNTEPSATCDRYRDAVDELWDFSYWNMIRCAASRMRPDVLRFVPPGYLRRHLPSVPSAGARSALAEDSQRLALVFFGLIDRYHPQRSRCFAQLQRRLGNRLVQRCECCTSLARVHEASHCCP
jgi:hypothetical protein